MNLTRPAPGLGGPDPAASDVGADASARVTVRLPALAANYREAVRRASPAAVAPVVKADAYSLGMERIAPRLNAEGADTFFVARLAEGMALRALLPRARIFVFDGLLPGTAPALIAHRLTPVLNAPEEIADWSAHARANRTVLDAAIQIDTGMNRSGLSRTELADLAAHARQALADINLALIVSHLACAEEVDQATNRKQLERFRAALAALPPAPASFSATAGIELGRDYLFDIVRPGLGLYGGNPRPGRTNPYKTVVTLTGKVIQLRRLAKGETVGYGATFTAAQPAHLAIVALGYADGLLRVTAGRGFAMLGGVRVPYAGRISMDLAALDVGDVPEGARVRGAEVEFLGDHVSIEDLAFAGGTIGHEILTCLGSRAERVYSV